MQSLYLKKTPGQALGRHDDNIRGGPALMADVRANPKFERLSLGMFRRGNSNARKTINEIRCTEAKTDFFRPSQASGGNKG